MLAMTRHGAGHLPPLVLLHGFLGDRHDWRAMLPLLGRHFHCLCIDLPGHGDSRAVELPTPGLSACAAEIIQSLEARGIGQFHLLGYSLGGRIALQLAKEFPTRLLSLSLESSHPGLTTAAERAARRESDSLWAERLEHAPIREFLRLWYASPTFAELTPEAREALVARRSHNSSLSLLNCYRATSLALQQDLSSVPAGLGCPCHYFSGALDRKFSALAADWQSPGLQWHCLEDAGHNLHLQAATEFGQRLLAALGEHSPC
ncbi:2-succinyl-6-hydroxy-2,4-cyclohexadiene-1-carboxylate synthase [Shewanella salipaludis]|uniref:Putative 2-succinyl-6-hydroxy-2,4-cyclohexadiene-1-carboxylate synthase n=1 Tax=Shewanella salipaludis TaxID=2723052 RepID=A0A972G0R1_9GAMM|nr:2-succinyl-6-hydroxy-2,4-cyclohexadiene-1-carboxylate synthase [Shewanella salipaludis]NMH65054.1 2-succinyl-6-hydroxy-2,4-cyclohexadiene-1-carboxylate synthase [Shewanella salipaludis]